jgi:hypothetical protein
MNVCQNHLFKKMKKQENYGKIYLWINGYRISQVVV